jgi:hypothetical protein
MKGGNRVGRVSLFNEILARKNKFPIFKDTQYVSHLKKRHSFLYFLWNLQFIYCFIGSFNKLPCLCAPELRHYIDFDYVCLETL